MKIPYNILIQIKMSVRPYFKGFTLIFFFYNCRKQEYSVKDTPFFENFQYFAASYLHENPIVLYNSSICLQVFHISVKFVRDLKTLVCVWWNKKENP